MGWGFRVVGVTKFCGSGARVCEIVRAGDVGEEARDPASMPFSLHQVPAPFCRNT